MSGVPRKTRIGVEFIVWVAATVIMLRWAFVEVDALYPEWNEARGVVLGRLIYGALIVAWICFFASLFAPSLKRLRFWFKIGICLAVLMCMVRNIFYREMNELLDGLLRLIHH